jgi:hypothetical protein
MAGKAFVSVWKYPTVVAQEEHGKLHVLGRGEEREQERDNTDQGNAGVHGPGPPFGMSHSLSNASFNFFLLSFYGSARPRRPPSSEMEMYHFYFHSEEM